MAIGVMPALEMAQESDKVISWRKQEGEIVTKGIPLLEIEADKAVMGNRIARREYSHRISSGRKSSTAPPLPAVSAQVSAQPGAAADTRLCDVSKKFRNSPARRRAFRQIRGSGQDA